MGVDGWRRGARFAEVGNTLGGHVFSLIDVVLMKNELSLVCFVRLPCGLLRNVQAKSSERNSNCDGSEDS